MAIYAYAHRCPCAWPPLRMDSAVRGHPCPLMCVATPMHGQPCAWPPMRRTIDVRG
eukprot:NODE_17382_length_192_cov_0.713287_g16468_i0.p2 GENE.NODE_17382_length_192_cov_0.713287_g16468_i0~~NODE_17382_length_192_cov_0.713287_g16468_i0.p2  ORF type:complete len:56 (+),score=3.56 NODE_17382_length_192_cov_0.713287_g16468_i0:1-168(+)